MNFYTVASRINKQVDNDVNAQRDLLKPEEVAVYREQQLANAMRQAERNMRLGIRLMNKFKEIMHEESFGPQTFQVCIRPDASCDFAAFKTLVDAYVQRRIFTKYALSYEQKGTSLDTLGTGFHAHIAVTTTMRSKGELLRATLPKFGTGFNVKIKVLKDANAWVKAYLVDYESKDGHKAPTREWDALWRTERSLESLYESSSPPKYVGED